MENKVMDKIKTEINENLVLKKLLKEYPVEDLLQFNEFNIGDRIQNNSYYTEQWRLLYITEMQRLNKAQDLYDKKAGERYDYYKYKESKDLSKVEIEKYYLPKDKELVELKRMIRLQELRVEYFQAVVDSFKSQGFNMKNFLENLKIGG